MFENDDNALQTLLNEARKPTETTLDLSVFNANQLPAVLIPDGYKLNILSDLEKHLPSPVRKKGTVTLDDADSFIWYVTEHGTPDTTRIYLQADYPNGKLRLQALLNDNTGGDQAHWRDHQAWLTPAKSVEWQRWTSHDRKGMTQAEFATWLEDNAADIAVVEGMPTATQMLEMALTFEATSEKRFKSAQRLQSGGVSFEFVDRDDDATRSRMQAFERFSLGLPVLHGGAAYRLDARLKYRIRDGALSLWYELVRPDKVLEAAAKDLVEKVRESAGFPLIAGNPNT